MTEQIGAKDFIKTLDETRLLMSRQKNQIENLTQMVKEQKEIIDLQRELIEVLKNKKGLSTEDSINKSVELILKSADSYSGQSNTMNDNYTVVKQQNRQQQNHPQINRQAPIPGENQEFDDLDGIENQGWFSTKKKQGRCRDDIVPKYGQL